MTTQMVCRVPHLYAGRQLSVGDVFQADEELVRTLTAVGYAEVVSRITDQHGYRTTAMVASKKKRR